MGQPVMATFVFWVMMAPFWPVIVVGIVSFSGVVVVCRVFLVLPWMCLVVVTVFVMGAQRFVIPGRSVVSAECGPSGRSDSKLVTGASGTVSKRE